MGFAGGERAGAGVSSIGEAFAFARRIKTGNHIAQETRDVKTRHFDFAELIGEIEIKQSALLVIFGQPGHRFVADGRARPSGFPGDSRAGSIVPGWNPARRRRPDPVAAPRRRPAARPASGAHPGTRASQRPGEPARRVSGIVGPDVVT